MHQCQSVLGAIASTYLLLRQQNKKFMILSNHNGSLQRRQLRAMTIAQGERKNPKPKDQACSVLCRKLVTCAEPVCAVHAVAQAASRRRKRLSD